MDKITKNPNNAKLTDSPRASNASTEIERYRLEVSKKSESDFINTRKLTIQSMVKHEAPASSEIDKQISDLEILIKRLQDEIVEMSNANKSYHSIVHDPPHNVQENQEQRAENKKSHEPKPDEDIDTVETNSHVYPVVVRDVGFGINDQSKKFADQVSELVNYPGSSEEQVIAKTFSSIRRDIDDVWTEENLRDNTMSESKAAQDDYHLQKLIGELKTEISETLASLNDGERRHNSEEEFPLGSNDK